MPPIRLTKKEINKLQSDFLELLAIDNESGDEGKIIHWVRHFLRTHWIRPTADTTKNLFFRVKGVGEPLMLCAHMDSVPPATNKKPRFEEGKFFTDGNTVLGADDLAGIIAILHTISLLRRHNVNHRPLEILFTAMEEQKGLGMKKFNFSEIQSREAVLPDLAKPIGYFVSTAPARYAFRIIFYGEPAHMRESENSLSAINLMAEFLTRIPNGKLDENTILNIGTIQGGLSRNIIPHKTELEGQFVIRAKGEIRVDGSRHCAKVFTLFEKEIEKLKEKYPKAEVDFSYYMTHTDYATTRQSRLMKKIRHTLQELEIPMHMTDSWGVSDANFLNARGVQTVVIGNGTRHSHTVKETASLEELVKLVETLTNFCINS